MFSCFPSSLVEGTECCPGAHPAASPPGIAPPPPTPARSAGICPAAVGSRCSSSATARAPEPKRLLPSSGGMGLSGLRHRQPCDPFPRDLLLACPMREIYFRAANVERLRGWFPPLDSIVSTAILTSSSNGWRRTFGGRPARQDRGPPGGTPGTRRRIRGWPERGRERKTL